MSVWTQQFQPRYEFPRIQVGKKEIEVLNSVHTGKEIFRLLTDAALYVPGNNVTLNDGETIGFSEDQCSQISESASDVLEGYTVKIEY